MDIKKFFTKETLPTYKIIYHIFTIIALISSPLIVHYLISKDKQIDVAQAIRLDKRELFREASKLITTRFYDQYRLIERINETFSMNNISDKNINDLEEMFINNYMESVREYNIKSEIISL